MRFANSIGTSIVLFAGLITPVHGQMAKEKDAERIAVLVKQLGDDKFAKREMASKELQSIGEKALPTLRAAFANMDFEVHTRGKELERLILLSLRKSKMIGLELVLIEPGEFNMGSPNGEPGRRADELEHKVYISKPFLMGAYEVAQDEFEKTMKASPSWFAKKGGGEDKVRQFDTSRFPVERVTWFDAIEFCNRLSKQDGYEPYYKMTEVKLEDGWIREAKVVMAGGNGFRLPTEAEWEYCCRAGTTTPFHYGRASTGVESNVKAVPPTGYAAPPRVPDLNRTARVGSYKPNRWGLYDMHGNVAEWCWDLYDKDYYANSPKSDPQGPDKGTHRILRGGNWLISNGSCRSASRFFHTPNEATYYGGFRVARTP